MPAIDITLDGDNAWPDLAAGKPILAVDDLWHLAVLEGGMASGAPSLALRLDLTRGDLDGGAVVAQTSLAAWIAATCALRGRFPDAFAGGPLEREAADEPLLGLASTRQLLDEVVARLEMEATPLHNAEASILNCLVIAVPHLTSETLDYRTIDGGS